MLAMLNHVPPKAIGLLSLVTLLLFGGVDIGLPMVDSVSHHSAGLRSRQHYEPAGGCQDHAESCLLVFSSTSDGAVPSFSPVIRLAQPDSERLPVVVRTASSHPVLRASSSRAPPSPRV
jgi:hypothetical protein